MIAVFAWRGAGGRLTSSGIDVLCRRIERLGGAEATVADWIPWWAWWRWREDAALVRNAAAGRRIVLIGNSMGARTARQIVDRIGPVAIDLAVPIDATWNAAPASWPPQVRRVLAFHGTRASPLGHDRAEVTDAARTRVENIPVDDWHGAIDDHPAVHGRVLRAVQEIMER